MPDADREAFGELWIAWKRGKGKPAAEAARVKLAATVMQFLDGIGEGFCEQSLSYLARVRDEVLGRVRAETGQADGDRVALWRGIRGGGEAQAFRAAPAPTTYRLLSYSTRESGGITFASMGNLKNEPGLLYRCSVPVAEVAFFEDPSICDEYANEYEVLVAHRLSPNDVVVVNNDVRPRASIRFSRS